jgi:hypothetical protein
MTPNVLKFTDKSINALPRNPNSREKEMPIHWTAAITHVEILFKKMKYTGYDGHFKLSFKPGWKYSTSFL